MRALDDSGLDDNTRVVNPSDHGDNVGARRIWRKSTMHDESAGIPLIMAGPGIPNSHVCRMPVSIGDMFPTILDCAGAPFGPGDDSLPGRSLLDIAGEADDKTRVAFPECHAAGAISGAYVLRTFRYKYLHYAGGYDPELYDLDRDPEEMNNLAADPKYAGTLARLRNQLLELIDMAGARPSSPEVWQTTRLRPAKNPNSLDSRSYVGQSGSAMEIGKNSGQCAILDAFPDDKILFKVGKNLH